MFCAHGTFAGAQMPGILILVHGDDFAVLIKLCPGFIGGNRETTCIGQRLNRACAGVMQSTGETIRADAFRSLFRVQQCDRGFAGFLLGKAVFQIGKAFGIMRTMQGAGFCQFTVNSVFFNQSHDICRRTGQGGIQLFPIGFTDQGFDLIRGCPQPGIHKADIAAGSTITHGAGFQEDNGFPGFRQMQRGRKSGVATANDRDICVYVCFQPRIIFARGSRDRPEVFHPSLLSCEGRGLPPGTEITRIADNKKAVFLSQGMSFLHVDGVLAEIPEISPWWVGYRFTYDWPVTYVRKLIYPSSIFQANFHWQTSGLIIFACYAQMNPLPKRHAGESQRGTERRIAVYCTVATL